VPSERHTHTHTYVGFSVMGRLGGFIQYKNHYENPHEERVSE